MVDDNTRIVRLNNLLSEYLRITECTDPNGPPLSETAQRQLSNRISGQAITIVETLLCSPIWQEIKERSTATLTARCPVCEDPAVPHNGTALVQHRTVLQHECAGSGWPIVKRA